MKINELAKLLKDKGYNVQTSGLSYMLTWNVASNLSENMLGIRIYEKDGKIIFSDGASCITEWTNEREVKSKKPLEKLSEFAIKYGVTLADAEFIKEYDENADVDKQIADIFKVIVFADLYLSQTNSGYEE